ncbi:hypothetical protein AGIG_G16936 [Arapaima gigas]
MCQTDRKSPTRCMQILKLQRYRVFCHLCLHWLPGDMFCREVVLCYAWQLDRSKLTFPKIRGAFPIHHRPLKH